VRVQASCINKNRRTAESSGRIARARAFIRKYREQFGSQLTSRRITRRLRVRMAILCRKSSIRSGWSKHQDLS